ncbi:MAG: hypothetical protein HFI63_11490 [Lachnospiraceae bacterium]|nr:hypothetical protein [Lachnospiraceae bacterium]
MRRAHKKQAEDFIVLLGQAHAEIKKDVESGVIESALALLEQCQEGALGLGNLIEKEEGEGAPTILLLESYCELVYQIHGQLQINANTNGSQIYKSLRKALISIENSVKYEIPVRLEVVFLPYKASMWDSLESVWMAADADPDCDAYVVPIPYYERKGDGNFESISYEGESFPGYVPITHYHAYRLEERKPDIIYIHNPYDQGNYVTSVDPRYYSGELKKYTDCLVYIPYYITAGGMSEGQALCPSYFHMDWIVVQSEKIIKFFDARVPEEKFLPLGSPKLDRIIRICNNPPEPPESWKKKMKGRKVYFYNTSLGGMLGDTETFLKKMEYVFHCFEGRTDACLLWRPHPLLESTFVSMRKEYVARYQELKQTFLSRDLGIYDDTPDIAKTIALCDAYIGDSGTSVTALFGMTGKPLFVMDNSFYSEPGPEDWRGQMISGFDAFGRNQWKVIQGNKLYYSPENNYRYRHYCNLSEHTLGGYYCAAFEQNGTIYVCPANAQDILLVKNHRITKRISLERRLEKPGAFAGAYHTGTYLFLIPREYPAIVRYDILQDKLDYLTGCNDIFTGYKDGEHRVGGSFLWGDYLLLASPEDSRVLAIDIHTMETQLLITGAKSACGCMGIASDSVDLWLLPYTGTTITRWNPETGDVQDYSHVPEGFVCRSVPHGQECLDRPFESMIFWGNQVIVSPCWGNKFLCLNRDTGDMQEWKPPFAVRTERKNGYYNPWSPGYFLNRTEKPESGIGRFFSLPDARLYDVNFNTEEYREIPVEFDLEELQEQEPGFNEISDWLPYGCEESYFNTLSGFLDGKVIGNPFDKERQLRAYRKISVNDDGTCGEKVHQFLCRQINHKRK